MLAQISDDSKKAFWRAEAVEVVEASEFRQSHVWAAASIERSPEDRAGGAEFGHIRIDHQRELKRQVLADAMHRMAGIDTDVVVEPIPGNDDGTGWRTRLRLHVGEDGTPGPYAARSHRVIQVHDLPLATGEASVVAPLGEQFGGAEFVDVVAPSTGNPYVLVAGRKRRPIPISERVGERSFRLDARGFWQVHRHAAETLTRAVQDAVDPDRFTPDAANLDLYGGVGLLAAAVGDRFGGSVRITTVESDAAATAHAATNLAEWTAAEAVTARVDRYLRQLAASSPAARARLTHATVILDPPRSGAGTEVVRHLAELAPEQLVYVACDPVALARDVGALREHGYELTRLRAFDLFPNTHHVEAVATMTRAEAS